MAAHLQGHFSVGKHFCSFCGTLKFLLNHDLELYSSSLTLDQLATGTGLGLRYDLEFLIIRIDWGFGLHVPYKTSRSGYFNIERFSDMHSLHFAIGYPF